MINNMLVDQVQWSYSHDNQPKDVQEKAVYAMGKWSEIVWYHMVVPDLQRDDCMIHLINLLFTVVDNAGCLLYLIMKERYTIVRPAVIGHLLLG
jgi:hypothetical protein